MYANVPHIQEEQEISILECGQIETKKKFKTPSVAILDIEHNKLNYVQETTGGVMHPSGDTIICKGSKEQIGEEDVVQILHLIQVELLVRVD